MTQGHLATGGVQQSLGRYTSYQDAERVVDTLADRGFPVERVTIVGSELRLVEKVVGRMTVGRAALAGAGSGAWFGLFIGLIFWIVSPWVAGAVVSAILLGAAFGAIFGAVAHALTRGRRDFASVSRVEPTSYEVMVDAAAVEEARRVLGAATAYPDEPTTVDPATPQTPPRPRP